MDSVCTEGLAPCDVTCHDVPGSKRGGEEAGKPPPVSTTNERPKPIDFVTLGTKMVRFMQALPRSLNQV